MSETYDAVYAVASQRIRNFDGRSLMETIANKFDISYQVEIVKQEFMNTAYEQQRPSILLGMVPTQDGDEWCALYGADLQVGIAGFGKSPDLAMRAFDSEWIKEATND